MNQPVVMTGDVNEPAIRHRDAANTVAINAVSFLVPDTRCAGCSYVIEAALRKLPEVESAESNYASKRVHVVFRDRQAIDEVVASVESLGYHCRPEQESDERQQLNRERRSLLARLGVAGIGMMQVMMYALATYLQGPHEMDAAYEALFRWASLALAVPIVLYSANVFHLGALTDFRHGRLGMDVPVSLAIWSAFGLSVFNTLNRTGEVYFDSVSMFTFFLLIARYVELSSRSRFEEARELTEHLLPVNLRLLSGETVRIADVVPGQIVVVLPGDVIPVDGVIRHGTTSVDESAFTGEVLPIVKVVGEKVLAGSRNLEGDIQVEVQEFPHQFVISTLSELYRQSTFHKPAFAKLIDRIARYFVFGVLLLATGTAAWWYAAGMSSWFVVALTVLVVSCPCALSLATPIAYTIAAGAIRKSGFVVRDGAFIEKLAAVDTVAFDKTGTLTDGKLKIREVVMVGPVVMTVMEATSIAASLEATSRHPVAAVFGVGNESVDDRCVTGTGVTGTIADSHYRIGSAGFLNAAPPDNHGLWIGLARERVLCWFRLVDAERKGSKALVRHLARSNIKTLMLTGDGSLSAAETGQRLGLCEVQTGVTPAGKVAILQQLQEGQAKVLMVGDGVNDAGALGIAFASLAISPVDAFVASSAEATFLGDDLTALIRMFNYARRVRSVIRQNIIWAIAYNLCVIPLAVSGLLAPWMAALGMSLSSTFVVLNANRLAKVP